jgi:hypothetical protein
MSAIYQHPDCPSDGDCDRCDRYISLWMGSIINEPFVDLLPPTRPEVDLPVKEATAAGVFVKGATEIQVFTYEQFQVAHDTGEKLLKVYSSEQFCH